MILYFFFPNASLCTSTASRLLRLSFCVLCCTGTPIYQCQSPVLKLNRLAHIDYHWIKNKAWCKFQIRVDNWIISANHNLLMNALILPSVPLFRRNMRAKRGKMFRCQRPFIFHSLTSHKPKPCGQKLADVIKIQKKYGNGNWVKYQEISSPIKYANEGIKSSMLK